MERVVERRLPPAAPAAVFFLFYLTSE